MKYATRITVILIATIVMFSGGATEARVAVANATTEEAAMVDWAIDRFEDAGLELPAVTVVFHDTVDGCRGFVGHYDAGSRQLDICNRGEIHIDPVNTLLHELAHAWSFDQLSESDRRTFIAQRSLESWDDSYSWWLMAQEQAAEIAAWGLMDDPFRSVYLYSERCADLATSFEVLTGVPPLHTNTDSCES